jgi:hypothetical protein
MMRLDRAILIAIVVIVELGLLYADGIIFIGFMAANNVETPLAAKLSMLLMCICDPISFILSWFKPKIAAALLAFSAAITLMLSVVGSDRHSLGALWLSGGIFWAVKFVLSYVFYNKLGSKTFGCLQSHAG